MNAMIRTLKGTLALLALAGLGLLLRWMTAGSVSGLRTYDLDSLTVLAVGTIAWIAYIWLALAVVLTVLEQVPGVVGALAGAVAGRITTKTARALLRSGLGVAAVTPLTVGVAHAAPTDSAHVRHAAQSDPHFTTQQTNYRTTEAASTLNITGTEPQQRTYRTTETASSLDVGATTPREGTYRATEQRSNLEITATHQSDYRATETASTLEIGGTTPQHPTQPSTEQASTLDAGASQPTDNYRTTEPPSNLQVGPTTPGHHTRAATPTTPGNPTT
ncbi:hypothetical protein, partial [Kribbella sp.]|uniref:hypothetical protein n=1 Tax=Kribbella sp. TaxID=1871183 RepID=UPI002D6E1A02